MAGSDYGWMMDDGVVVSFFMLFSTYLGKWGIQFDLRIFFRWVGKNHQLVDDYTKPKTNSRLFAPENRPKLNAPKGKYCSFPSIHFSGANLLLVSRCGILQVR